MSALEGGGARGMLAMEEPGVTFRGCGLLDLAPVFIWGQELVCSRGAYLGMSIIELVKL
jgi:hypothetical protein